MSGPISVRVGGKESQTLIGESITVSSLEVKSGDRQVWEVKVYHHETGPALLNVVRPYEDDPQATVEWNGQLLRIGGSLTYAGPDGDIEITHEM